MKRYNKRFENLTYEQKEKLYKEDRALHDELKADYIRRKREGLIRKEEENGYIEGIPGESA